MNNPEEIRSYCLSKKGTSESFPFDETTLVFKVMNKMYALLNLENPISINLKCEPEQAIKLREEYHFVVPGYHMNKLNWNTIMLNESFKSSLLKDWIDDSYNLIIAKLSKKEKAQFDELV
jgi:predicted DNA-binding protein (MmcQ/YjbR family)